MIERKGTGKATWNLCRTAAKMIQWEREFQARIARRVATNHLRCSEGAVLDISDIFVRDEEQKEMLDKIIKKMKKHYIPVVGYRTVRFAWIKEYCRFISNKFWSDMLQEQHGADSFRSPEDMLRRITMLNVNVSGVDWILYHTFPAYFSSDLINFRWAQLLVKRRNVRVTVTMSRPHSTEARRYIFTENSFRVHWMKICSCCLTFCSRICMFSARQNRSAGKTTTGKNGLYCKADEESHWHNSHAGQYGSLRRIRSARMFTHSCRILHHVSLSLKCLV